MKKKREKFFTTPKTYLTCTDFFNLLFVLTQLYSRCFEDAYRARAERLLVIYESEEGSTAYLPDTTICVRNLFFHICTM